MAAVKVYDLAVKTGEYQSQGETKARYENVGLVMKGDDGKFFLLLKRTFNPAGITPKNAGDDNILIGMFPPRENSGGSG